MRGLRREPAQHRAEHPVQCGVSAYMDVIRDRQIAVLRARNLEFLEEQVRAARSRFEVGEGTRTDVAQAEASRSSAVAQLAAARAQAEASAATYHQIVGEDPGKLSSPSAAKGAAQGSRLRRSRSPMSSIRRSLRPSIWSMPPALPSSRRKARCCRRFRPTPGVARDYANTVPDSFISNNGAFNFGERRLAADGADLPGRAGRGAGAPIQGIARPGAHRGRRHPRPGAQRRRLGMDAIRSGARERRRPTANWCRPPSWR